jgi:ABC-2 type transport system ATP-binding protein
VGRPKLVVLDEPTTGLDVDARETVWRRLDDYRQSGGTLLITGHYLEEIQALASRVVVIDRGTVIADGSVDEIRNHVAVSKVSFRSGRPASYFESFPAAVSAGTSESGVTTVVTQDADATVRRLVTDGVDFRGLEVHAASLEEAFRALTSKASAQQTAPARSLRTAKDCS